ncbi:MAG: hypothetical protein DRP65_00570 [Planctomycetota bacterium]|nr:MAG: hypothetical protein DRP65_00570 [Planctomycetota bacterium]
MIADNNELMVTEMTTVGRMRLDSQIQTAMEAAGYKPYDYKSLDLGFELPITWPLDPECEVTQAQLIVIARKLNLRVVNTDTMVQARKGI